MAIRAAEDAAAVVLYVHSSDELAVIGAPAVEAAREDRLAKAITDRGADPVRQVSLDETWSAVRYRQQRSG